MVNKIEAREAFLRFLIPRWFVSIILKALALISGQGGAPSYVQLAV
ncbi:MAG: hypothetical protein ABSA75_05820 [Candidatus Bathyarchaeia archaeon]|jgi:hypothetical protein